MDTETPPGVIGDLTGQLPEVSASADTITQKAEDSKPDEKTAEIVNIKRGRGRPALSPDEKAARRAAKGDNQNVSRIGGIGDTEQRDRNNQDLKRKRDREKTAEFIVHTVETSGSFLAGEKAKMEVIEKEHLNSAVFNYLEVKDIGDLPPGVMLCYCLAQYYGRILTTQEAKPKMEKFAIWVHGKIGRFKHARSNRRNVNKRQDNSSEKNDEAISSEKHKNNNARSIA